MNTTTVSRDELITYLQNADPWRDNLATALDEVNESAEGLRAAILRGDFDAVVGAAHGLREDAHEVASYAVWIADTLSACAEGDPRAGAVVA